MATTTSGAIESREDYKTPREKYGYWETEIKASNKARRRWHKQGDRIVKRFVDQRKDQETTGRDFNVPFRLNLFHSNVTTVMSMLYGNVPKVDASRRYADPNDDVSRVAAEILERLLNNDIADNGEEYNTVLRSTLQDRLLAGLGVARVRYEVETERVEAELTDGNVAVGEAVERVISEDAPVEYFHWRDVLWGWCRSWSEMPWLGYRIWLTKDEVKERFGEKIAGELDYKKQITTNTEDQNEEPDTSSVWEKAEIWEIWDKVENKIVFLSIGYDKILDIKEDNLGLSGFYPSPPFFLANPTTTLYQPTPDYHMSQDLYQEIDRLQSRIAIITEAVKVVGVYDAQADGIQRMLKEGTDNTLIPINTWQLFAEKGGLNGQIDWMPLQDIVGALDKLVDLRDQAIALLYQITGMSDIMRGGSAGQYEGVGTTELKAKYGSVRVQALQDEFARFASDLMQLKAEIICKHFEPKTILTRANIENTYDKELAPQAIELLKNPQLANMRVKIRPESVAMVDYQALKAERTEFIGAIAVFMQSAAPMLEQDPKMKPALLQLLQWGLAGFKGASDIEGVLDKAVDRAIQETQEDKPDPAQQAAEQAQQALQAKTQAEIEKIKVKAQADMQLREQDKVADIETHMATHNAKMAEIQANMQASIATTKAKMEADILTEQAQSQANAQQAQAQAGSEIQKNIVETQLDLEAQAAKTTMKINEIAASSSAKIKEAKAKPIPTNGGNKDG